MEATEFSGMFVISGFIFLEKNSPQKKLFRNANRHKQEVHIVGTCLLTNFGEVQFSQPNKASAMCSNNPTSKQNQSSEFPVFESYTLQARQIIGIVSQIERVMCIKHEIS